VLLPVGVYLSVLAVCWLVFVVNISCVVGYMLFDVVVCVYCIVVVYVL